MALPQLALFKSKYNSKYLRYVTGGDFNKNLQYSSDKMVANDNSFKLEAGGESGSGLVNIKSTYNNRYLQKESQDSSWIVATADKPNEDKSQWSCTLFQVTLDAASEAYKIIHAQEGKQVVASTDSYRNSCLYLGSPSGNASLGLHELIDRESLVVLPEYVVFKGDNGKYLSTIKADGYNYLHFAGTDPLAKSVGHQTFLMNDGTVRIKSLGWGYFWRASPNWIWCDSNENDTGNRATLFSVVKNSGNVVALRNLGNNLFCKRIPDLDWKFDCLKADESSISVYSRLEMSEYVISREIYNVQYRLDDTTIYDETIYSMDSQTASNGSSVDNTMGLNLNIKKERSSTWSSTNSWKIGVSMTIDAGIPFISSGSVTSETEYNGSYTWGETETVSLVTESVYTVTVPPMTEITVKAMATKGTADVPFSYTQRDVLPDGSTVIKNYDDGIYKVTNNYNFYYDTHEKPLAKA